MTRRGAVLRIAGLAALAAALLAASITLMGMIYASAANAATPVCQIVHVTEGTVKYPLDICNSTATLHSTTPWVSKAFPETSGGTAINVTPLRGTCHLAQVQENSGNGPDFLIRACEGILPNSKLVFIVDGGPLPERSTSTPVVVQAETLP